MSDDIVKTLLESLTDEQKAQLVQGLVSNMRGTDEGLTEPQKKLKEETVSSQPRVNEDFTVNRKEDELQRKSPVKARNNEWEDMGEDRDHSIDYEKMANSRTPRRRGKPKKRNVECHVCGKSFAMNENLIYGEFVRCNRCTGR